MKTKKSNLILIGFSMVFLLFYITKENGLSGLLHTMSTANPAWIGAALLMMLIYWGLEACVLHLSLKQFHPFQKFKTTIRTSMIGQFFNCVTPFSSGGQPMQACHMVKSGVPLGSAGCSLMVKFIVYQFVLTIYSAVTLLLRFSFFSEKVSGMSFLILTGFGINAVVILGLLCICFWSKGTNAFLMKVVHLLAKCKLVKDETKTSTYIELELSGFYGGFQVLRKNPTLIVKMAVLSVVQLTGYFLIPYFIFQAFQLGQVSLLSMLSAEAFVLNISSFVPLPGAAGGAELSFHTMFGLFFPPAFLSLSILLWRGITFYLPICVGMLFVMSSGKGGKGEKPKKQIAPQKIYGPVSIYKRPDRV